MDIGAMMMELAGLSFLGFGAQAPMPEWGLMLNEGRQYIQTSPWLMIYPGLAIFIVVAIFNLWGDSLRDVLDPRQG
jgi:peptide/nickel transport system permease protein/nickel transport system permease protein